MMNFNFCNYEDLSLQNEDKCRLDMNFPIQSAFLDMYHNSDKSTETKSNQKTFSNLKDELNKKNGTKEKKKIGKWTKEEDEILKELVLVYGGKSWKKVAEHIRGRTEIQCLHRWTKILQPGLVKGPWTIQEDRKLISWIKEFGPKKWSQCSEFIKGRSDKQCRERWFNCLNPQVKKGNWSSEEDYKIFYLYKKYGSKWAQIANYFEGRSENSVKNRFYSTLRRYVTEKNKSHSRKKAKNSNQVELLKETLDPNAVPSMKSSAYPKEELLKYFEISFHEAKMKFVEEKKFNERDLKLFDSQIDKKEEFSCSDVNENISIKNNNSVNFCLDKKETKSQSSLSDNNCFNNINMNLNNLHFELCNGLNPSSQEETIRLNVNDSQLSKEEASNYCKNMDIYSLEKNISDMCDENNMMFQEPQFANIDNYIDNMMEGIFKNKKESMDIEAYDSFNNFNAAVNYDNVNMNARNDGLEIFGSDSLTSLNQNDCVSLDLMNNSISGGLEMIGNASTRNLSHEKNNSSNSLNNSENFVNSIIQNIQNVDDVKKRGNVLHSLFDQLNDLERLIKNAKKELIKYEKTNTGK